MERVWGRRSLRHAWADIEFGRRGPTQGSGASGEARLPSCNGGSRTPGKASLCRLRRGFFVHERNSTGRARFPVATSVVGTEYAPPSTIRE